VYNKYLEHLASAAGRLSLFSSCVSVSVPRTSDTDVHQLRYALLCAGSWLVSMEDSGAAATNTAENKHVAVPVAGVANGGSEEENKVEDLLPVPASPSGPRMTGLFIFIMNIRCVCVCLCSCFIFLLIDPPYMLVLVTEIRLNNWLQECLEARRARVGGAAHRGAGLPGVGG
jgi:hypothetical protein